MTSNGQLASEEVASLPERDGVLTETIPYSQFLARLTELEESGCRVASVTVDKKNGKYRLTVLKGST